MQTQDMQDQQELKTADPAQVALDAINDFDAYLGKDMALDDSWVLYARADLRVQYAQLAETRRHTNLLTGIFAKLQAIEFNTRGQ
jgi:hypothetical protein